MGLRPGQISGHIHKHTPHGQDSLILSVNDLRVDIPPKIHILPLGHTSNQVSEGHCLSFHLITYLQCAGRSRLQFNAIAASTKRLPLQKTSISSDIRTLQFVTQISHCTFPVIGGLRCVTLSGVDIIGLQRNCFVFFVYFFSVMIPIRNLSL